MAVLNWIRALPREAVQPSLILRARTGALLDQLPDDVQVDDLRGRRTALTVPALRRALAAQEADVVYSATSAMNLAVLAARPKASILLSEHTSPKAYFAEAKLSAFRQMMVRRLYPRAAAILAPTSEIAGEIDEIISHKVPCAVLANPVLSGPAPAWAPEPGLVVSAGRLVAVKGMDILIRAIAAIDPPVRLRIFGEGPEKPALEALCRELGVADRVELAGFTDRLQEEVARAACFVLASRREGFGNVLIEALHGGVPVVATALPGPRAILEGGKNGTLVPPDDPAALAGAIRKTLESPAGSTADVTHFSVETSTAALVEHVIRVAR